MLLSTAQAWLAAQRAAVLVEVSEARGSVPREAGTRMLVSANGVVGTIGGGHLEWKSIEEARRMLASHDGSRHTLHFPLGPALGQCCGGAVTVEFERLAAHHLATWPAPVPRFHLQLYGAGHVGRAVARLLVTLPCAVDWIDERDDEFPESLGDGPPWPVHIRKVAVDAVEGEAARAPAGAAFLVVTHQHALDERIVEAILRRGDFGFLGLIGSKTKRQKFVHRFEARGLSPALIERMVCPIGLPGIVGKEPELIAISVVAQLLQETR
jgi:xanthine dehydrogenase accessory factor